MPRTSSTTPGKRPIRENACGSPTKRFSIPTTAPTPTSSSLRSSRHAGAEAGEYTAGVDAGERAIGERAFREDVGHFWGLLETRPYMRARAGFAACLWQLGEREEAVAHRRDMLRLNPNDNQGIRYTLLGCLLAMGSDERAAEILDDAEYSDDATATWPYSQTLLAYRRTGLGERAEALLSEARRTNPHVPAYLLGKKALPEELPEMVGFGDESEAIAYPADNLEAWRSTPGALEWLGKATV